ncbi:hypothetical protein FQN54_004116 [Arachnomyces sp. PD_36]|nr:hypothetical protein FQN54_004116 [Arachnomyces sp. PD_36]
MAYDGYRNPQQQQQQPPQPSYHPAGLNNGYPEALNPQTSPYQQQPPPPPPPSYPNQYIPEQDRTRPQPQAHPPPPPPPPPQQQPQQPPQPSQLPTSPGLNSPVIPPQYTDASRRQYQPQQAPINDAVNTAFNNTDTSRYLSPDVISQITATVIQQLKSSGLDPNPGHQPVQPMDLNAGSQPMEPSRSNHSDHPSSSGNRTVYTPPSPHRTGEEPGYRETHAPPPTATQAEFPPFQSPRASPMTERRPFSPPIQQNDHIRAEARPKYTSEISHSGQESTLEKIWGQLFDKDGNPTARLGQLLRGIAVHLIEDYAPGNTIIITPQKLQKYYEDTRVPGDTYPWQDIFDDGTSSISRLFREVQAEHHLVQEKLDERPDTPGLTPRGFERWATLMIQAHPQQEYDRLHKAVLDMPINNPDNRKERFPKEIPRRLFPVVANQAVKEKLEHGISTHCKIDLSDVETPQPPKPTHHHHRSESTVDRPPAPTSSTTSDVNRDKQPYCSTVVDEDDEEDEEPPTPSRPIERERKPYSAQPGKGKTFSEGKKSSPAHAEPPTITPSKPVPPPTEPTQEPAYLHPRGAPRKGSPTVATRTSRHNRSPSVGVADYRRSEGDLPRKHRSSFNSAHGPSNGAYPPPTSGDVDDIRRYREAERPRDRDRGDGPPHDRDMDGPRYREIVPRGAGGNGWASDEDYYRLAGRDTSDRGLLGGRAGYDYDDPPSYPGGYR